MEIDEIDQIILRVPSAVRNMFVGQPFIIREVPQIDAAFSLRFTVANILLRKDITLEHFQEDLIRDPRITNIANKITIEELTNADKQARGASLRVKLKDGKEYTSEASFAKADPVLDPLSKEEVKQKFMNNVAFSKTISEVNAEKMLTLIENLEEVDKISELIKLMTT